MEEGQVKERTEIIQIWTKYMSEKITYIKRTDTDAKGDALVSRQGKPYTRLTLKVESRGERYISGFGNQSNVDWAVGDEVDITITESTSLDKNGKPYLNFSQPKKGEINDQALKDIFDNTETILNKLVGMSLDIEVIRAHVVPKTKAAVVDEEEIDLSSEIPF